jgi:hypothetical protein
LTLIFNFNHTDFSLWVESTDKIIDIEHSSKFAIYHKEINMVQLPLINNQKENELAPNSIK